MGTGCSERVLAASLLLGCRRAAKPTLFGQQTITGCRRVSCNDLAEFNLNLRSPLVPIAGCSRRLLRPTDICYRLLVVIEVVLEKHQSRDRWRRRGTGRYSPRAQQGKTI